MVDSVRAVEQKNSPVVALLPGSLSVINASPLVIVLADIISESDLQVGFVRAKDGGGADKPGVKECFGKSKMIITRTLHRV